MSPPKSEVSWSPFEALWRVIKSIIKIWNDLPRETKEYIIKKATDAFEPIFQDFYKKAKGK